MIEIPVHLPHSSMAVLHRLASISVNNCRGSATALWLQFVREIEWLGRTSHGPCRQLPRSFDPTAIAIPRVA
jgi:hypothetical protein